MISRTFKRLGSLLLLGLVFNACNDKADSLFDPDFGYDRAQPVINSIEPSTGYLAGIDFITVLGENFHPTPDSNRVYFDGQRGVVLAGSDGMIEVRPANVVGDDVQVKVAVPRAEKFSEPHSYSLERALEKYEAVTDGNAASGITVDNQDNIYFQLIINNENRGIYSINSIAGDRTEFKSASPGNSAKLYRFTDLKLDANGVLYAVRGPRAIFTYDPTTDTDWQRPYTLSSSPSGPTLVSFDFDDKGFIWAVGNNENIFRIKIDDGTITNFPFSGNLRSSRFFDGDLYVAGNIDSLESVHKISLDANSNVVSTERILNMKPITGSQPITSLEISASGEYFLGLDRDLTVVNSEASSLNGIIFYDGTSVKPFYEGILPGTIKSMAWGNSGLKIITNRKDYTASSATEPVTVQFSNIYSVNMLEKQPAPYQGLN